MADIDYSEIISRSWQITRKSKWLWVYGLALGAGGYAGSNLNFNNLGKSFNSFTNPKGPQVVPTNLEQKTTEVLGLATTAFRDWLTGVPTQTWVLLGLALLAAILFAAAIALVLNAWVTGALIGGLKESEQDKTIDLGASSALGIKNLKNMVFYAIISAFLAFALLLGLSAVFGAMLLIFSALPLKSLWLSLGVIIGVLAFFLLIILLTMVNIYAQRLIVLRNLRPWEAWKKGLSLGKGHFLPTVIMGIINTAVGCLGTVAILVVAGLVALPSLFVILPTLLMGIGSRSAGLIGAGTVFVALAVILISLATALLRAIIVVFTYGNWNLFFEKVLEGER